MTRDQTTKLQSIQLEARMRRVRGILNRPLEKPKVGQMPPVYLNLKEAIEWMKVMDAAAPRPVLVRGKPAKKAKLG